MGDSGGRKRSKKSKRLKRLKRSKKTGLQQGVRQSEQGQQSDQPGDEIALSEASQLVVIELQRTELSRLLREQQRLNDRVD
ncbi:MAG: hypothetical protein O7G13_15360, partial [Alphaproteobacteria bacterium]|nr:hypothetical protein [Alphaproteobacteria bacterium]